MATTMIYPWHQPQWRRLTQSRSKSHHALLLTGQAGIGKREFALALCQNRICPAPSPSGDLPCQCQNCRLFNAGTHPDFHVLTSELESVQGRLSQLARYSDRYQDRTERDRKTRHSQIISVDQVRQLIARFATHAHISKTRVVLILPADSMNISAANSLLKLLEEPPPDSVFVLVTAAPGRLPATIRSRCVTQTLSTPDSAMALEWIRAYVRGADAGIALKLANGGPLEAKSLYESGFLTHYHHCITGFAGIAAGRVDPVDFAAQLNKLEFHRLLIWLQRFVMELIRFDVANITPYWADKVKINIANASIQRLYGLYDRIGYYRRIASQPVNRQLAIEDLVLAFQRTILHSAI